MKIETIVHVGTDGGDLTLHGVRNGSGWLFSLNQFDQTMAWVDDGPVIDRTSDVVETWRKAVKLLDEYPWHQLYPLEVHPEFQARVLKAVVSRNKRSQNIYNENRWLEVCSVPRLSLT